jgi:GntR family transcriptional regulator
MIQAIELTQEMPRSRAGLKAEAARRVRDRLRDDIRAGYFKDGLLPPEPALMVEEHASRNAVRLALNLLRAEGLVERFQGVGTVVVGATQIFVPLDPDVGIVDLLDDGVSRVRFHNLATLTATAPPGLARRLDIPVGAEVVFLERVMLVDGRPLTLRSSWIPATLARAILDGEVDLRQSIFDLLTRGLGFDLGVTEYSIEAALADEAVASVMNVPVGNALVLCESLTRLADGRPIQYGYARSPADRVRFVTSVTRGSDPLLPDHGYHNNPSWASQQQKLVST